MTPRADAERNRARILAAAEEVFAEHGPSASTEEVATRAGVAIGTVFRHFPTKQVLLAAIMKNALARLVDEATGLAGGDPATGLFTFYASVVEQAAQQKTVVELLAQGGTGLDIAGSLRPLQDQIEVLLIRAQRAGAIRPGITADEVIALLASSCQGAMQAGWTPDLRRRVLDIIFAGLGP